MLASLSHPNIAGVYGVEESNGRRALVMELAEGGGLSDYDVSPDGSRFVMFPRISAENERSRDVVTFVTGWFADIERTFAGRK